MVVLSMLPIISITIQMIMMAQTARCLTKNLFYETAMQKEVAYIVLTIYLSTEQKFINGYPTRRGGTLKYFEYIG